MTVVSESPLCLKLHLNKFEVKKYFTNYDSIVFDNPYVKETVNYLFDIAATGCAFESDGELTVEVFPTASGGCIFRFTCADVTQEEAPAVCKNIRLKNRPKKSNIYLFQFDNFEAFLPVVKALYADPVCKYYPSSLYDWQQKYYLKIQLPAFDRKNAVFIHEYSNFSARGERPAEILSEYGRCVAAHNAIFQIGEAFFKEPLMH